MRARSYVNRRQFILDYATGKKVLDCGVIAETEADTATRIAQMPQQLHWQLKDIADAVGTDLSPELVADVNAAYPELRLIAADMETIDLDETFDLVIMGDLIEHLSNPGRALDHVAPLLRPDGELLITCPNAYGLPNCLRFLAGRFEDGNDHVLSFSRFTLENLLQRHGFRVVAVHTCLDRDGGPRLSKRIGLPVLRRFPEIGGTLLVVARRHLAKPF